MTIQAKILELIRRIQKERGISVIYITHDLGVVAKVADYVDVMYAGKIVETGTIDEIFYDPKHPYTWGLLSAMPLPNPVVEKRRVAETYDYATSGIDYSKGTSHHVEGSHYVKCTDEEFAKWCK